jgi:hypothetical protein
MPDRRELERRISAFISGYLDGAYERYGDDFDFGVFAFIAEVQLPGDPTLEIQSGASDVGWICSDARNWVQAGLFRRAYVLAEYERDDPGD